MTNFDFLQADKQFHSFSGIAVSAEKILHIDTSAAVLNCRRAMEFAVKWMYSVDGSLAIPWEQNLVSLMGTSEFRDIVDDNMWKRMDLIRRIGNNAAHSGKQIAQEQAELCLENLFIFLDFVAYCYAENYTETKFDKTLLFNQTSEPTKEVPDVDIDKLIEENKNLKEKLTARREEKEQTYVPKPLELTEYKTRKIYIDAMLLDADWIEGKNWLNEVELFGMPNKSEVGYADYVLYADDGKALAVIEAKRTCVDVSKGRQQAKLYADLLEKKHGVRPIIFLTNGFDTRIHNDKYDTSERKVASFYSKRDLQKLFNLHRSRTKLKNILVDKNIAGRYYQIAAIRAVCDTLEQNRRKALLVMATGSGKTRTVIALVGVLLNHTWVKNVLFLADRNSLVTQAKRSFANLLPDLSVTNLCEDKDNYNAHCVFSTYQTMMNVIDTAKDNEGKLYTVGHFDLIICDEAHRSIYNKYKDIFNYFDAPLVGLTATPKDEIDKNTYEIFELQNGLPTYGYELSQAVKDGYLVDFLSVESKLKFLQEGISYPDLTEEQKAEYEDTFKDENGEVIDKITSSALNEWVFNEDTIKKVLDIVMSKGIRIDYGNSLGKTIIFAKNHKHAEEILRIFGKEYPNLPGFAKVIDNYTNYAQSLIDEFSDLKKMPQIAISVDMLDTGIDIPEVVNLVFFKKVMSKAKFWQMIGRGTRLCPNLIGGNDKDKFYIFDFCGNFEFFRINQGKPTVNMIALQSAIFNLKLEIARKLQDIEYQTNDLIEFRESIVDDMYAQVCKINRDNFAVKQHLKYVDTYSNRASYENITYENSLMVKEEVSPYIAAVDDEPTALRFDALMYGIELAYLLGKKYTKARSDLVKKISAVAKISNIPEIMMKQAFISSLLHTDYIDSAGINEFEHIREELRSLMKYIPKDTICYNSNIEDDILSIDWNEAELENDDLKNYKARAEYYIRQHENADVIQKLKTNKKLTEKDIFSLQDILWKEVGTKEDYEAELGAKPLGEFVREIVGLDMNAAKEAFAQYLDETSLDSRQIYFVNQIVEYIVQNGVMKDLSVLLESPFSDKGSVVEVFTDLKVWHGIRKTIEMINSNVAI
ncbi:MAG: DEAD/DEAH box helicase family protein [Oscillospiraceae bacterium]